MAFKPLEEVLESSALRLPDRAGRVWVINPPDAMVWQALNMRLAAAIAIKAGVPLSEEDLRYADEQVHIADAQEPDFARQCLNGPNAAGERTTVYEQMLEAGINGEDLQHIVQTAFLAWTAGEEAAELYWNSGGKAWAQSPTQSRPGLRQTETPTPSAAASTTPSGKSASGTPTRRKQRAAANRATRTRGSSRTTTT